MIQTERASELRVDLLSAGPVLDQEPAPGRLRRGRGLVALLAAAGAAGVGWGVQQEQEQAPVLVSVHKAVARHPTWGTLAADVPGTSCGALVDWALLGTRHYGLERSLPCADGSEVWVSISVDDDRQQVRIRLEAQAAVPDSALPHSQR